MLFSPWHAKGVALGSAAACLVGVLACWVALRWPEGETTQHVLGGLFLAGGLEMSVALNILPSYLSCPALAAQDFCSNATKSRILRRTKSKWRNSYESKRTEPSALAQLCVKIDRAIVSGNHPQVVELCSRLLDDSGSQKMEKEAIAASYLNRGFSRRRVGDLQGALEDARQAARLNPRSFKPHLNAALVYAQDMQNYAKGLEEFDLALRLNPTSVEILSSRGLTKQLMGDHEGAETDLKAALGITPNDPNALCNLGNLQLARGNVSEAAESYQKALTANPKDSQIRMNLALTLERMGAQRAAADVLRKDRRAIKLWESKGGYPVRPSGRGWRLALLVVVVVGILILLWLMNLQMGTR